MASTATKETLILLKKRLERAEDDKTILHLIHKLSKVPVTLDILQGTGAGKNMRTLAKRSGEVGIKASSVLNKWREIVADSQSNTQEQSKKNKHSRSNYESINKESSDIRKLSAKHAKEKHDKVKHSKEKHLKSGHKEHIDSYKMNRKIEKESKKRDLKESGELKYSDYSFEKTCKYYSDVEDESKTYVVGGYSPDHPEIFPQFNKSKHDSKQYELTYEPSLSPVHKKPKLEKYSPENESANSTKKQLYDSCLLLTDSISKKCAKDNFHEKTSKSSKFEIQKNGHAIEKCSKISERDNVKKSKKNKDRSHLESPTKKKTKKMVIQNAEQFTASEALFEDCLSFNDIIVPINKRKSIVNKKAKINKKDTLHKVKTVTSVPPKSDLNNISNDIKSEALIPNANYKELDIVSKTLPQTLPNYRPFPQISYEPALATKKKAMSNEEAIKFTSSRREKTAVYSGRKNNYLSEVPSLFECCTRILIENIDDIEYMGEIPFFLLESMLRRCTPTQLYRLEHFNPNLLEETDELWGIHCKRDYRNSKPQENETWRDLYWRSHDEQEKKLRNVTANITASIANSNPVRKVKLAYIDAVVKPPREVARRQSKNGTALPTSHSVKAASPTKTNPKPVVPAVKPASSRGATEYKPQKPKVAPLMAKTLKSMKQCFRR